MSRQDLRIHNTDIDNLIDNLRGEVGEVISTWVMMRSLMAQEADLQAENPDKAIDDPQLVMLHALTEKLEDEIIARLSELAETKVGRLNFHFAHLKLNALEKECAQFDRFIERYKFHKKRNYDISHKELPEKWTDHKYILIRYPVIVLAIAMALRLMKLIDRIHLGPRAPYLWREMRSRRYKLMNPAKVGYMLLPYLALSAAARAAIIVEEMAEGCDKWEDAIVKINGKNATIKIYKEFGAIAIPGAGMLLDQPFVELSAIDIVSESGKDSNAQGVSSGRPGT